MIHSRETVRIPYSSVFPLNWERGSLFYLFTATFDVYSLFTIFSTPVSPPSLSKGYRSPWSFRRTSSTLNYTSSGCGSLVELVSNPSFSLEHVPSSSPTLGLTTRPLPLHPSPLLSNRDGFRSWTSFCPRPGLSRLTGRSPNVN